MPINLINIEEAIDIGEKGNTMMTANRFRLVERWSVAGKFNQTLFLPLLLVANKQADLFFF